MLSIVSTPSRVASWWIARGRSPPPRGTRASRRRAVVDSRLGGAFDPRTARGRHRRAVPLRRSVWCARASRRGGLRRSARSIRSDCRRRACRRLGPRMKTGAGDRSISSTCSTRDARCSSLRSPPRRSTCSAATTTRTANVRRCGKRRGGACARRARGEGTARRSPEKGAAAGDRRLSWGTWNGPPRVALGHRWRICRGSTSRSGRHGGASRG